MRRNKELYNGIEEECNIKINIFTDGIFYVLDVYGKVMQSYQQVELSDGGELEKPKQKSWW